MSDGVSTIIVVEKSGNNNNLAPSCVLLHRVGIIGEMISGFNPFTLAPFGDDGEYEDDEEEQEKFDAEHKIKDEPHHGNNESNLIDEARK